MAGELKLTLDSNSSMPFVSISPPGKGFGGALAMFITVKNFPGATHWSRKYNYQIWILISRDNITYYNHNITLLQYLRQF